MIEFKAYKKGEEYYIEVDPTEDERKILYRFLTSFSANGMSISLDTVTHFARRERIKYKIKENGSKTN